ncbi:alpha/beta hydrolase [Bradyrhizobium cosmicum]|uniref:alpha/beta fold hydrolase n=1 Tax=Bradyrhizobium cosmicum TaxID=1404864 RepID=UPI0028E36CE4|nr:alpha/beta hydrolase [Bradyrhizobium cosmicum]
MRSYASKRGHFSTVPARANFNQFSALRAGTSTSTSNYSWIGSSARHCGSRVCTPRSAELRNPPIGKFLECDGVVLQYVDRSDPAAPCVVLLHGNGSLIQDFTMSGLVDLLARKNRVVCFDRSGFGYSQRPRLRIWTAAAQAALLVNAFNQLGIHDPVVPGHSWGAFVATALGVRKDYPIRGLVLASGYYFPIGRVGDVRSSHTGPGRLGQLHCRACWPEPAQN